MTDTVHTFGRWRRLVAFALFALCIFTALTLASTSPAAIESPPPPQVWSDKADYVPGETVTLSGANWAAGESVHIRVNDDAGQTWSRDVDVTAADDGTISDQFSLPNWFVAQYSVTATGATSGTATWSFTDGTLDFQLATAGNAAPSNVTWSVNWDLWQGTGMTPNNSCSGTPTFPGIASYTGNTLSSGTRPAINNNASAKPTSAQTTGSFAGQYVLDYWSSSATSTTALSASQICQAGVNGPTVLTLYAHFKLADSTPPATTIQCNAAACSSSYYNANVSVTLAATDNASGSGVKEIRYTTDGSTPTASDAVSPNGTTYSGAFTVSATATVKYRAFDNAGNAEAVNSQQINIDKVAPTVTASAVKGDAPSFSGATAYAADTWTNKDVRVTFTCADTGGSGLTAGSGNQTQEFTTDTSGTTATFSGTCADNAGNPAAASTFGPVKIDKTAPVISDLGPTPASPNGDNGWYITDVSNGFEATDATSGLSASCIANFPLSSGHNQQSKTTTGEGAAVTVTSDGCTDVAGNSAAGVQSDDFMIDKTAPTVTVTPDRSPDQGGWYNHAVVFSAAASSNGPSGAGSCDLDETYSGPDDASASVSMDCTDGAGNTGTGSASFQYDGTAPTVSATPSRSPDHNGWYNHAFSVSYTGTDDTSDIDECDADDNYSGPDTSSGSVSGSCTDNAGNSGSASYGFQYDATDPTISATLTPAANGNGWNNTDVDVHFTCSDNLSGIDPAYGCPVDQTLTSEGLHTLHVATADDAGNVVTPSFDVRIDKTTPTITGSASPAANSYGWNNTNVTVSFSCADGLSGLDSCESDHVLSSEGAGQSVTGHATDKAGNQASATVSDINIDKTKPVVAVTGVSNGAVYTLGSVPAAGCSTSDALSGVKTAATLSSSGGPVGSITATCSGAEDKAGNTNSASVTYTVNYNFTGFFAPVDNDPTCNAVKAGSAIPIKFSLHGYQGMDIFAAGYPKVSAGTCSGVPLDTVEETVTAGGSSLNYDATSDQYIYVWKTDKSWAGKAMRFTIVLADGTTHYARFSFTR